MICDLDLQLAYYLRETSLCYSFSLDRKKEKIFSFSDAEV